MKEYLLYMSKYNRAANGKMLQALGDMSDEERAAKRKGYYKSLQVLLDHIATSAIFFQKTFRTVYPDLSCFGQAYYNTKYERGQLSFPVFDDAKKAVSTLDDNLVGIVEDLPEEGLQKEFTQTWPNISLVLTPANVVFRLVTHGIHHRGQVAQVLDELGIENDFSRMAERYE